MKGNMEISLGIWGFNQEFRNFTLGKVRLPWYWDDLLLNSIDNRLSLSSISSNFRFVPCSVDLLGQHVKPSSCAWAKPTILKECYILLKKKPTGYSRLS